MWSTGYYFLSVSHKAVTTSPNSGEVYYLRGCEHLGFVNEYGDPFKSSEQTEKEWETHNDLAIKDFSQAIELIPDCANAYWKRGRCNLYRGAWSSKPEDNLAEISDYKKAIELVPTSSAVHYDLWRAYLTNGSLDLAEQEFETLIKLDPERHSREDLERDRQRYSKR